MRVIFSAMLVGTLAFGVVVVIIILTAKSTSEGSQAVIVAVLLGAGVLVQLAIAKVEPALDTSTPESLGGSYRSRCVIRTAAAEGASLIGLVAALISGQLWVIPLVALLTFLGWRRAAPTEAAIRREEERLQSQGSPTSLTAALWSPTPMGDL